MGSTSSPTDYFILRWLSPELVEGSKPHHKKITSTLLLKNIISLFISAAAATGLSLILNAFTSLYTPHWWLGLCFFTVLCFILNLVYAFKAGSEDFTGLLMAGLVSKLLLALLVILIYSFSGRADFFYFSLHFIGHYILFTIFEIRYLLHLIKNNQSLHAHEN